MPKGIDLMPAVMPMPGVQTIDAPDEREQRTPPGSNGSYIVILYNCDCHTFEQVITQLQKAIGCTEEKGEAFAMEVHTTGRSIVYSGSDTECEKVANVLREIKLQVETDKTA
ncbi:MAG: ATP-dependent Clp protease adaptor ClpS [Janthinobacterium lividum]